MVVTEKRTINEQTFDYTYSDAGFYIERDGAVYEEAYDPENSGRVYTETDTPIEPAEDEEKQYAEAGRILMGVE